MDEFDQVQIDQDGSPANQAGSHPFAMTTTFGFAGSEPGQGPSAVKDLMLEAPVGQTIDPSAVPICPHEDFVSMSEIGQNKCPDSSALGVANVSELGEGVFGESHAVYRLAPPPGVSMKFGFIILLVPVTVTIRADRHAPDRLIAEISNLPNLISVGGVRLSVWGTPAASIHDQDRGQCAKLNSSCPAHISQRPLLTTPRHCDGPLLTSYATDSWEFPGARLANGDPDLTDPNWLSGASESHDNATPPYPLGQSGCGRLAFNPTIAAKPTTKAARARPASTSPRRRRRGPDQPRGPGRRGYRQSGGHPARGLLGQPLDRRRARGLHWAQLARETAFSEAGAGCPNAAKIGTVEVESPLLDGEHQGCSLPRRALEQPL